MLNRGLLPEARETFLFSKLGKLWQLRLFGNSSRKFPHEIWKIAHLFWDSFSSVQFSHSVMSDSLRPYESQHPRPPCPSTTPGVYTNSCALSRWCHPTMSSSVLPFSSCPQSLPASQSFPMSQLFARGGQSIGVSIQHQSFQWIFRTEFLWGGLIGSPCSPRDSQESSPTPQFKSINSLVSAFFIVQLSHPYMTPGKTIDLTRQIFVGKVIALLWICHLGRSYLFSTEQASFNLGRACMKSHFISPWSFLGSCHCCLCIF